MANESGKVWMWPTRDGRRPKSELPETVPKLTGRAARRAAERAQRKAARRGAGRAGT
jgi:hypothetical protein